MDTATIGLIGDLVSKLGFPIVVSIWLLWRFDRLLTQLVAHEAKQGQQLTDILLTLQGGKPKDKDG